MDLEKMFVLKEIVKANGFVPSLIGHPYARYRQERHGCNMDDPFVIPAMEDAEGWASAFLEYVMVLRFRRASRFQIRKAGFVAHRGSDLLRLDLDIRDGMNVSETYYFNLL